MNRVFKTAAIGIMSFTLSATALPAQNAYVQDQARYQTAAWHDDRERHDHDWDRRERVYVEPYRGGSYYAAPHNGRTAALTIGGAAVGAVIGGAAGHGQGAAVGAVVGGVAGFIAGESTRHY